MTDRSSLGRPWRCDGTSLPPQVLLMAKMLWLLLIRQHFLVALDVPFLPFWKGLESLERWPDLIRWILQGLFVLGGLLLWANVAVRWACGLVGGVVMFALVGSMPLFRNHLWICGCLLWLSTSARAGKPPVLAHWQFGVLYAGAALNKLLDPDWRDGTYLHEWLTAVLHNPVYRAIAGGLPEQVFAVFLSWLVMLGEVLLAVLLVTPRWQLHGVWLTVAFHGGMWLFLLGYRFGHFIEDILIGLLSFLHWPTGPVRLRVSATRLTLARRLVGWLDWNRAFVVESADAEVRDAVAQTGGREARGLAAWAWVLRYTPGFYLLLLALDFVTLRLLPPKVSFALAALLGGGLVAFFLWTDWVLPRKQRQESMKFASA